MSRKVLEYQDLLTVAVEAARRAGDFIRKTERPRDSALWTRKGFNDFVTDVDRTAERIITAYLEERFPESQVRGEELSPDANTDGLVWVVDPLDGTTNYLHDYPAYAVSIAAVYHGTLCIGVVQDVARWLTYTAVKDEGAWSDGLRLHVSSVNDPSTALIGTGFPFKTPALLERYMEQFSVLIGETSGIRRGGAAALDLIDVALGRLDGFWELELAPWDVAAGTLVVREAGGVVTDADGSSDVVKHGSIVAGNAQIHGWLMDKLGQR